MLEGVEPVLVLCVRPSLIRPRTKGVERWDDGQNGIAQTFTEGTQVLMLVNVKADRMTESGKVEDGVKHFEYLPVYQKLKK